MVYQGKSYFLLDTEYIAIIHVEKFYRLRRLLNESEDGRYIFLLQDGIRKGVILLVQYINECHTVFV
jgi:hypothetical protein